MDIPITENRVRGKYRDQYTTRAEKSQALDGKICPTCKHWKAFSEYYENLRMRDGLSSECKDCKNAYSRQWYQDNKDQACAASRKWYSENRERALANVKAWRKANRLRCNALHEKWRKANPEHYRELDRVNKKKHRARHPDRAYARNAVTQAIQSGELTPQPCEWPGCIVTTGTQSHHADYSKPLEVNWLCEPHHRELHRLGLSVLPVERALEAQVILCTSGQ